MAGRIDTHHHFYPPDYVAANRARILAAAPTRDAIIDGWDPARALEQMDRTGVAAAILSISAPGVWFGDPAATRAMARDCNEYAARLVADHPGRFGMFAALPLPDIDASLREIAYAFDVLRLDGVGLMTSCDGRWPGDPAFAPVFDELQRRQAVVYLHPTVPDGGTLLPGIPPAIVEFPADTTRAVVSLLYGGTLARCPSVRFIFSHGGGTVPFLADRIASLARRPTHRSLQERVPGGVEAALRRLYYDLVSISGNPPGMAALRSFVPATQLLYGTDYPFHDLEWTARNLDRLDFTVAERQAIERGNALALLPRFAG